MKGVWTQQWNGDSFVAHNNKELEVREILYCEMHGNRWLSGDEPCKQCRDAMDKENKITAMLSKPKTRKGNVWPLDKWSKKV